MSRTSDCLMDAGSLPEFSQTHSVKTNLKRHISGFIFTLNLWHERSEQRRQLQVLALDPDLLNDVGLSVYDVRHEASKPFWRE